uniref:BOS complex subunit NCLN n=1 Tax=Caenorhabditis japonica TaxID=281687 RepID=A0A8R1HXY5_CAEJA
MQEEIIDFFRNPALVFYMTLMLTVCVVNGSQQAGEVVETEFHAYRIHQYEISGNMYGSKNYRVSYEAVSLGARAIRRTTVTTWREVLKSNVDDLWELSTGAVLIFIPDNIDELNDVDRKAFIDLEQKLAKVKTDLAVYVAPYDDNASSVISDIQNRADNFPSAFQALLQSVSGNTISITSSDSIPELPANYKPYNIVGRLSSGERATPTIAFVAHYDTTSVIPGVSPGADSNGSGVVALLELLAVLSKFYDTPSTRPPYNLLFIWTAAGKLNFQGTRHWIEEFQKGVDAGHVVDSSSNERKVFLDDRIDLAICIESIGRNTGGLYMRAGKAPSENSAAAQLFRRLRNIAPKKNIELVSKKISLTSTSSWEHEKFNIKRMPAITLSTLPSPTDPARNSVLDLPSLLDEDELISNIRLIAEGVLGYILELPETGPSTDSRVTSEVSMLSKDAVDKQRVHHFIRQFASRPRPVGDRKATESIAANLASVASGYGQVFKSAVGFVDSKPFGVTQNRLVAERVKPAVFELVIAAGVFAYLSVFYFIATHSQKSIEGTVSVIRKSIF